MRISVRGRRPTWPGGVRVRATVLVGVFTFLALLAGGTAAAVELRAQLEQQVDAAGRKVAEKVQSSVTLNVGDVDLAVAVVNKSADPDVWVSRGRSVPVPDAAGLSLWPFTDARSVARTSSTTVPGWDGLEPVFVTLSMRPQQESLDRVMLSLGIAMVLLPAVLMAMTWVIAGRVLRPVDAIRREVAEISEWDLARRVPVPRSRDEIYHLAETMNTMLDRLEAAATRQQQFVGDASHELRSPLAALRAELEIALEYPGQVAWPDVVRAALADTLRIEHLATDLLLLTRLENDRVGQLPREPVDLAQVALEQGARRRGAPHHLQIETAEPVLVMGQAALLSRLLGNLLDNAERHCRSRVDVRISERRDEAVLEVSDDGPGIPASQLEHVFERFTRLDQARTRDHGGAGLGLAIARMIAGVHGGTLTAEAGREGTRFVARLPLAARPSA